eukprot:jgi/Psemu1/23253/gm1.23253_g
MKSASLGQQGQRGYNLSFAKSGGPSGGPSFTGKPKANPHRYHNNVFRQFTPEQKAELKRLDEDTGQNKASSGRRGMTKSHRKAAAIPVKKHKGHSDEYSLEEETPSPASGNHFGLAAHTQKKAKHDLMGDPTKRCELDSHADTVVAGLNMTCISKMDEFTPTVDVEPFASTYNKLSNTDGEHQLQMPMELDGVMSFFHTRLPTEVELDGERLRYFWVLTTTEQWRTYADTFVDRENAADVNMTHPDDKQERHHTAVRTIGEMGIVDDGNLLDCMLKHRNSLDVGMNPSTRQYVGDRSAKGIRSTHPTIRAEELACRWHIGIDTAKQTLQVTTQKTLRNATHPVDLRFKRQVFHYKMTAQGKWFSDMTFFKRTGILNGDKRVQLSTNGHAFSRFCNVRSKAQAHDVLQDFMNRVAIPDMLVTDGSKEQGSLQVTNALWKEVVKKYRINQSWTEPYSWWQNLAEKEIGEMNETGNKEDEESENINFHSYSPWCYHEDTAGGKQGVDKREWHGLRYEHHMIMPTIIYNLSAYSTTSATLTPPFAPHRLVTSVTDDNTNNFLIG